MGVWKEVPYQAVHRGMRLGLVVGVAKRLGLAKRIPELCRRRGWPPDDEQTIGVLARAVACVKLGALGEVIDVPALVRGLDKWAQLGERAEATQIVSVLNLGHLLEP